MTSPTSMRPRAQLLERGSRLEDPQLQPQRRLRGAQLAERHRHEAGGGGRERGEAHGRDVDAAVRAHVVLGAARGVEQRLGVLEHRGARLGERQAARLALEQLGPELLLEARDVLRDGGLREAQRVGGGGEGAARGDLSERLQQLEIEHKGRYHARLSLSSRILL